MKNSYIFRFIKYTWLSAIVAIIIFYLCCLIPSDDVPNMNWNFFIEKDKVGHFCMYFGLSLISACNYIYIKKGKIIILKMVLFAIIVPVIYGGIIEIVQYKYFPNRSGDWYDFLADALGTLCSIPISLWFRKIILKREEFKEESKIE